MAAGEEQRRDTEFSLLSVCALQQALKVACSGKLASESRTWISAYTAAVLSQLLTAQVDPRPLCHVVIQLMHQAADSSQAASGEASAATDADAAQHTQQAGKGLNATPAGLLLLPAEAQTLASLLTNAQDLLYQWHNPGRTTEFKAQQPADIATAFRDETQGNKSSKKRRKAQLSQPDEVSSRVKKQKAEATAVVSLPSQLAHGPDLQLQVCLTCMASAR